MASRIVVVESRASASQAVATTLRSAGFEVAVVESPRDLPQNVGGLGAVGVDGLPMIEAISRLPVVSSAVCTEDDGAPAIPWYRAFAGRRGKQPRY